MYLQSVQSVKHNAAMSVNRSILKKNRHIGIGLLQFNPSTPIPQIEYKSKAVHIDDLLCIKRTRHDLKGIFHKIFDFRFFSGISVPQALGRLKCFLKICGDIHESMFISVNNTGDKFVAGVIDTGTFQ